MDCYKIARKSPVHYLLLGLLLVSVGFLTGAKKNKKYGQECKPNYKRVFKNGKHILESNSNCSQGACKKWINKFFCTKPSKCATRNSSGKSTGATHVHKGKTYVCTSKTGDQWKPLWYLKNGQKCPDGNGSVCASGKCARAIKNFYCTAKNKTCGGKNKSGYTIGSKITSKGSKYKCVRYKFVKLGHNGAGCNANSDCASNKCKNYIEGKRCTPKSKDCYVGWKSSEGIKLGQVINNPHDKKSESRFKCTASGLKKQMVAGKICSSNAGCMSNKCKPVKTTAGIEIVRNGKVCLAKTKTCPWPRSKGFPKNTIKTIAGKAHKCQSNGLWKKL